MPANKTKYGMLAETLKSEILGGKYGEHNPFPSIRALIRRFGLSDSTVQRALDELASLGMIARKQGSGTFVTRQGASRTIGLIMPGVAYSAFFGPIVSELNRLACENRYKLQIGETYSSDAMRRLDEVRDLAASFVRQRVAGVIFQPPGGISAAGELNYRILNVFLRAKIPVVTLDDEITTPSGEIACDVIGIDDVNAGVRLAKHLIGMGVRQIHFLLHSFSETCDPADENRLLGVMAAVVRSGLPFDMKKSVLRAAPDDVAALKRHIRRRCPDAFICSNDAAAAIFRRTLAAAGLDVPQDVMLAGFGDLPISALMSPPLTTMQQYPRSIARGAFKRLLDRIEDPTLMPVKVSVVAPLVARASTDGRKWRLHRKKR